MNWLQSETSKKIILLSVGIGVASVIFALFMTVLVLFCTSRLVDSLPIPFPVLLRLGELARFLFETGPVMLAVGAVLYLCRRIALLKRRKPKSEKASELKESPKA